MRVGLVICSELSVRQELEFSLETAGFNVCTLARAGDMLKSPQDFGVALIDQQLPDMGGVSLIGHLRQRRCPGILILVGGRLTVEIAVAAFHAGADDVLGTPCTRRRLARALENRRVWNLAPAVGELRVPSLHAPALRRWANAVASHLDSPDDLRTIERWSHFIACGSTALWETCSRVGVHARASRDLGRSLRAFVHGRRVNCPAESLLEISDHRTLLQFSTVGGLSDGATLSAMLRRQSFVPFDLPCMRELRAVLTERGVMMET
jgi:CheY-like chemotaxis protein